MNITDKRFKFACWALFLHSVTTIIMKFDAGVYKVVFMAIVVGFLGAQSYTDAKKVKDGLV